MTRLMNNNKRILVFSATYNEIENIRELISGIKKNLTNASILIIDDNSPDKTQEVIKTQEPLPLKNL